MKRFLVPILIVVFMATATATYSGPVEKVDPKELSLAGLRSTVVTLEFNAGERASVIARIKKGATSLGLYVYDKYGNCVAWDDEGNAETCTIAAVDWVPSDNAAYTIEVRNNGFRECKYLMVVR